MLHIKRSSEALFQTPRREDPEKAHRLFTTSAAGHSFAIVKPRALPGVHESCSCEPASVSKWWGALDACLKSFRTASAYDQMFSCVPPAFHRQRAVAPVAKIWFRPVRLPLYIFPVQARWRLPAMPWKQSRSSPRPRSGIEASVRSNRCRSASWPFCFHTPRWVFKRSRASPSLPERSNSRTSPTKESTSTQMYPPGFTQDAKRWITVAGSRVY